MLMLLLFLCASDLPEPAQRLIDARLQRDLSLLPERYFDPATTSDLVLQEYLLTLGQLGDHRVLPRIQAFFQRSALRDTALFAYGEVAGAPLEPLLALLPGLKGHAQILAMEALTKSADEATRARVVQAWLALDGPGRDRTVLFMWRHPDPAITDSARRRLAGELGSAPTYHGYLYYLLRGRRAVPSAVKLNLLKRLERNPESLMHAIRLKTTDQDGSGKALIQLCSHRDWRIRVNAVAQLASVEPTQLTGPAVGLLLDDNPSVIREALKALLSLEWDDVDGNLATVTDGFSPSHLQTLALASKKERAAPFLPLVLPWTEDKDPWKRVQGIAALGRSPEAEHHEQLLALVKHKDPVVAHAALSALTGQTPFPRREAVMKAALDSDDPYLQTQAVALAEPDACDLLTEMAGKHHREIDFPYAYLDQLERLCGKEGAEPRRRALLSHPDYLVRLRAFQDLETPDAASRAMVFKDGWRHRFPEELAAEAVALMKAKKNTRWALETQRGRVVIELYGHYAPITVANIHLLTRRGYFNDMPIHRVVPNFVLQAGDRRGDGAGGPGYSIPCEVNMLRFRRGAVGMALAGKDTGGGQFFICHAPQPHLDGGYTVFGQVMSGMDVVDLLEEGNRIVSAAVE